MTYTLFSVTVHLARLVFYREICFIPDVTYTLFSIGFNHFNSTRLYREMRFIPDVTKSCLQGEKEVKSRRSDRLYGESSEIPARTFTGREMNL